MESLLGNGADGITGTTVVEGLQSAEVVGAVGGGTVGVAAGRNQGLVGFVAGVAGAIHVDSLDYRCLSVV